MAADSMKAAGGQVVFELGGTSFGMDANAVRAVAKVSCVLPVARGGSFVCGIVKIKGRALPVYDLAGFLGRPRTRQTSKSRLIVAEGDYGTLAFVVDGVVKTPKAAAPARAAVYMSGEDATVDVQQALANAVLH